VLAGHLGKTVAEIKKEVSSLELTEWIAFYEQNPFDSEGTRADMRQAITTAAIAGMAGGDTDPKKYMPKYGNNNTDTLNHNVKSFISKMKNLQGVKNG
jgi:hypothetical protein